MTTASTHALHPQQDLVCQPFSQKKQIFFKPSEKQFSFLIHLTMEELIEKFHITIAYSTTVLNFCNQVDVHSPHSSSTPNLPFTGMKKKTKKQKKAENWKKRATHFTSKGGKLEKVSRQVIMSVEHLEEHFTKAHIWLQQPIMQLHLFHIFLPCCFKTGHLQVTSNIVAGMGCLLNSSKANNVTAIPPECKTSSSEMQSLTTFRR
jgi:hypothetical protein